MALNNFTWSKMTKTYPLMHNFLILLSSLSLFPLVNSYDGPLYDHSAYTECKAYPEEPLYNGGILQSYKKCCVSDASSPSFLLHNLSNAFYTFSAWVMIEGNDSTLIRANLQGEHATFNCIGTVIARQGCWSFLKGGFVLDSPSNFSILFFKERKRFVTIHVSNLHGERLVGASIFVEQISKDFPIGSAIASTIIGNIPYQSWFLKRFNAAVFENELKWYITEPQEGKTNYTLADNMLQFVRANQITTRGHNIFWEDLKYTPTWVKNLDGPGLKRAVDSRISGLMGRYREEFIHWDVNNEMLHFDFYEERLGPNATLGFFRTAQRADPLATLFMNEFNVVETCSDVSSTVDDYVMRLIELKRGGVKMGGIGLEGHFSVPNPPLIRGVLDKLGTLGLPIWLTEVDISHTIDKETQAIYLEKVLREGYSHPSIQGLMLWTALHLEGCYQMCLTDDNFHNLPTGNIVDKLLEEWETSKVEGVSDQLGSFSFHGFLGDYKIVVKYGNKTQNLLFSLTGGHETRYFNIQI